MIRTPSVEVGVARSFGTGEREAGVSASLLDALDGCRSIRAHSMWFCGHRRGSDFLSALPCVLKEAVAGLLVPFLMIITEKRNRAAMLVARFTSHFAGGPSHPRDRCDDADTDKHVVLVDATELNR